jgi:4-amino-4-deoxy-L-arabinose transferase-like glycosyltransferase
MIIRYAKLLLIGILVLGFVLRVHNHQMWPREGATFDEYAWTWLGVNIIQQGIPMSWSPHPQYKTRTHYVSPKGARFWIVSPYLEHPPLFGIVAGAYALMRGAPDMYGVQFSVLREFSLLLGVITIYCVYLFAKIYYGVGIGLLSSFLYAIVPTIVIGSRILQNENFFIPLFLCMLVCLKRYIDTKNRWFFAVAAALAGVAVLSKVPWIAASVAAVGILFYRGKAKDAWTFLGIVSAFFFLYLLYGMYWDREVFFSLWRLQLHRYDMAFDSILSLVREPYLVDRYYADGWIYAGWVAFTALLIGSIRKHAELIFACLGYFFIYIVAIPNEPSHGWYRYPFYPFLMVATALFIRDYWRQYLPVALIGVIIALSLLAHTWGQAFGFSYTVYRGVIVWFAISALPVVFPYARMKDFAKKNMIAQCFVIILLSVWAILQYTEQ